MGPTRPGGARVSAPPPRPACGHREVQPSGGALGGRDRTAPALCTRTTHTALPTPARRGGLFLHTCSHGYRSAAHEQRTEVPSTATAPSLSSPCAHPPVSRAPDARHDTALPAFSPPLG